MQLCVPPIPFARVSVPYCFLKPVCLIHLLSVIQDDELIVQDIERLV